jgi:hypothetical protein
MSKVIFYPNKNGSVSMILPMLNCGLTIEEIAIKDTPADHPYIIVEREVAPEDETFFDAWEADFSSPHGHGIGANQWFINQYQAKIATLDAVKDADQIAFLNSCIATQQAEKAQRELEA